MNHGDWVVYDNGGSRQIGRVISVAKDGESAFVCYSHGCTAARTRIECLHLYDAELDKDVKPDIGIGFNRFADFCPVFDPDCCYRDCVSKFGGRE